MHSVVLASAVGLALSGGRGSLAKRDDRPLVPRRMSRKMRAALLGAVAGLVAWAAETIVPDALFASMGGGAVGAMAFNRLAPAGKGFRHSLPREFVLGAAAGFSSDRFADLADGTFEQALWRAIGGAAAAMVIADFLPPELQLEEA